MYKYICNVCGFGRETDFSYRDFIEEETEYLLCPECGNLSLQEFIIEKNNINSETELLDEMKDCISSFGNKQIWRNIESIADPIERITSRTLFFEAGGRIEENV